jgi:hypothetical protein
MIKMARKSFPYFRNLSIVILFGIGSWALYNLIFQGVSDLLIHYGIENVYIQNLVIVVGVLVLLAIIGYSVRHTIKKLVSN